MICTNSCHDCRSTSRSRCRFCARAGCTKSRCGQGWLSKLGLADMGCRVAAHALAFGIMAAPHLCDMIASHGEPTMATDESTTCSDENSAYGGFLMGIQSYTLRKFPTERVIEIVHSDLGLSGIEFYGPPHFPINSSDEQIKDIKDKTSAVGMKLTSHGVDSFTKNHDSNRRIFEFAKKAGLKNITADPSEDSFESLDKLVDEYGIRIAIHNHGPNTRYDKIAHVLNAIKGHNEKIGSC